MSDDQAPSSDAGPSEDPKERNATVTSVFRRDWSLYDKMLHLNAMRHREVYETLGQLIAEGFDGPFTLADFGCGDASWIARTLQGTSVSHYLGVDLVEEALESARRNLAVLGCPVDLIADDFSEVIRRPPPQRFDVLLACYSLHHLSSADKAEAMTHARSWLSERGILVIIDLTIREEETRAQVLERSRAHFKMSCPQFTSEELQQVHDHQVACDWPESPGTVIRWAAESGYSNAKLCYLDEEELFSVICCSI